MECAEGDFRAGVAGFYFVEGVVGHLGVGLAWAGGRGKRPVSNVGLRIVFLQMTRKVKVSCTYDRGLDWERRFYAVKGCWGNDRARAGVAEDERGQ
jgi:hypothetical protein